MIAMIEKVAKLGIKRDPRYLYFLRGSQVCRTPKLAETPSVEIVAEGAFAREPGWVYYLDHDGDVVRAPTSDGSEGT